MTKLSKFLCFVLSWIACIQLQAQDLEGTYQLGLEQFKLGHHESAALAFERVLYFGNGEHQVACLHHLADMQLQQGNPYAASEFFGRASVASEDYPTQVWYTLRKCSGLLQASQSRLALVDLLGIGAEIPDTLLRYKNFLLGITQFAEFNFSESRLAFKEALKEDDIAGKNRIDSLFIVLSKIKHPNPKTAKTLSIIFPGAGQFYAGDIKNGINSLLLAGSFLALGINTAIQYSFLDALTSVMPWFQRYYMGGYHRAERIAAERLHEKQDAVFQEVLNTF